LVYFSRFGEKSGNPGIDRLVGFNDNELKREEWAKQPTHASSGL
jgi:hypothetical protein